MNSGARLAESGTRSDPVPRPPGGPRAGRRRICPDRRNGGDSARLQPVHCRCGYRLFPVAGQSRANRHRAGSAQPYLRGAPPGLPFLWDEETLRRGLNFTLETALGDIDLLGEATGGNTYETLLPSSWEVEVFGVPCRIVSLDRLIEMKRAAGRPKDLEALAELEALRDETGRP